MAKSKRYEKLTVDTVWPTTKAAGDLEWKLRNAPDELTREDQLVMASVCSAYRHLREKPGIDGVQRIRNRKRLAEEEWKPGAKKESRGELDMSERVKLRQLEGRIEGLAMALGVLLDSEELRLAYADVQTPTGVPTLLSKIGDYVASHGYHVGNISSKPVFDNHPEFEILVSMELTNFHDLDREERDG